MLFVLAWLLWLYHQDHNGRRAFDGKEIAEEETVVALSNDDVFEEKTICGESTVLSEEAIRAAVSDKSEECLFIGPSHQHSDGSGNTHTNSAARDVIDEEILSKSSATVNESAYNDFDDWDEDPIVYRDYIEDSPVRQAKLLTQNSMKRDRADPIRFSSSDILTGTEDQITEVRHAKLASQPSIKRDRGKFVYSPKSSFTPISPSKDLNSNSSNLTIIDSIQPTTNSSLSVQIKNSSTIKQTREVSVLESNIMIEASPLTLNFATSTVNGNDSMEDSEVASAFSTEDEDMQYKTRNGTLITLSHEAAGRIHSIVVKDTELPKATKIRCSSPRVRAASPRIRAQNVSPNIISMKQDTRNQEEAEDLVHLVVNKHPFDVHTASREHIVVENGNRRIPVVDEEVYAPVSESVVESGNPSFEFDQRPPTSPKPVGKLPKRSTSKKDPNYLQKHTAAPTDFDAIMKRRKNFVDTMDDAGRLLGQIAHRDEKIGGGRKVLSKHWSKVKEAVRKRQYLHFKPMK